jgi:Fe-S-cluster containining protein
VIPALHSGCATCRGACCRTYLVHVSGRDAIRIARHTGLPLERFIDVVPEADPPGSAFHLDDGAPAYALALRRASDGACTFLTPAPDGAERCGVYAARPLACAMFPLFIADGEIGIKPDVICDPRGRCIDTNELPLARTIFERAADEWSEYAIVVATWNEFRTAVAAAVDVRTYFAYLCAAYDAIDALLAESAPEQTAALIATAIAPVVVRALGE